MPALVGREKVSPVMQSALQRHIVQEREKRKQEEAEAEKDSERKAKEEEEKRKKLEEDHSTLEDIKKQLVKLKDKHDHLREEKHQIFQQFRKVLTDETKQKSRLQQSNPLPHGAQLPLHGHGMQLNPHHMLPPGYKYQGHQQPYLSQVQQPLSQSVKRPHSPTPPPSGSLPMYQRPPAAVPSSSMIPKKPREQSPQFDDRYRPYISMMQGNKPPTNYDGRNSNPMRRNNIKTERDQASYSPNGSSAPSHHKYQTPQAAARSSLSKHT